MEKWKDIPNFSNYQVSNKGRVRTWKDRGKIRDVPKIMHASDDGNGYLKLMLYDDSGKRYCKKVHRLVAEAFVKNNDPKHKDTVDHKISGPEGKLDNRASNLRWISRRKNIQKAYRDGMCDQRIKNQRSPIIITDMFSNEEEFCHSVSEASSQLGVDYTTISHACTDNNLVKGRYKCEKIDGRGLLERDEYFAEIEAEYEYH